MTNVQNNNVDANKLRTSWSVGEATTNAWLSVPHVVIAEAMATQPWNSITLDMHHGFIDLPDVVNILAALGGCANAPVPFVRVPWNDPGVLYRVLDAGARGVICPMINTKEDAESLVKATKYPPMGQRSFGPIRPMMKEGAMYVAKANASCLTFAQIETRQAMENLNSIVSTKGLDGIYVGPSDLAFDHGMIPEFDSQNPNLLKLLERILESAKKFGLVAAMHCATPAYAKKMIEMGFDMVTIGSDIGFLIAANQGAHAAFVGDAGQKVSSGY